MNENPYAATDRTFGVSQFDALATAAEDALRLRAHYLLHQDQADTVQRFLVSFARGTYLQPHRHSEQWEMLVILEGSLNVLIFDANGSIIRRHCLDRTTPVIEILPGTWHGVVTSSLRCTALELKPGPFRAAEFASWAPPEGSQEVDDYLQCLR